MGDELTTNSKKCVGPYENDHSTIKFVLRGMQIIFPNGDKIPEVKVGNVWQNLGFMSTTNNEATSSDYAGCKPESHRWEGYKPPESLNIMKYKHTDALKINGKWIEKCSAYPSETEFLVN